MNTWSLIFLISLEVASKPQIRFKGKAQADEKAQARQRRDEQCILRRSATQPLGLRWGFETTSKPKRLRGTEDANALRSVEE
jgi:hypothetical protein